MTGIQSYPRSLADVNVDGAAAGSNREPHGQRKEMKNSPGGDKS